MRNLILPTINEPKLCPRTLCLWKPGIPVRGMTCTYAYTGKMPCTGPLVCHQCGGRQP